LRHASFVRAPLRLAIASEDWIIRRGDLAVYLTPHVENIAECLRRLEAARELVVSSPEILSRTLASTSRRSSSPWPLPIPTRQMSRAIPATRRQGDLQRGCASGASPPDTWLAPYMSGIRGNITPYRSAAAKRCRSPGIGKALAEAIQGQKSPKQIIRDAKRIIRGSPTASILLLPNSILLFF
jgi:hypothetical protein